MKKNFKAALVAAGIKINEKGQIRFSDLDLAIEVLSAKRDVIRDLKKVWESGDGICVVDGYDDWYAARIAKPSDIAAEAKIQVLVLFHSGFSGISTSGIVIFTDDLPKFKKTFEKLSKDPEWTKAKPYPDFRTVDEEYALTIHFADGKKEKLKVRGTRATPF